MRRRIVLSSLLVMIVVAAAILFANQPAASCLFTALDVGQGDAVLIQTPDGQDMLVDGGPRRDLVSKVSRLLPPGDQTIELVVFTQPDADHLTGLIDVINQLQVLQVFINQATAPTKTFATWQTELRAQHLIPRLVHQGEQFQLGKYLTLNIVWPPADEPQVATNELSVGMRLTCAGSTAFMIGDASSAVEARLLQSGQNVQAELLKVSHHGSKYSSSHAFLAAVRPSVAVISVGAKNRYHHPHPVTLERLKKTGIPVWRTDIEGNVRFRSDGHGGWRVGG